MLWPLLLPSLTACLPVPRVLQVGGPVTDGMQGLADEVAAWMGGAVAMSGPRALPAAYTTYNGTSSSAAPVPQF